MNIPDAQMTQQIADDQLFFNKFVARIDELIRYSAYEGYFSVTIRFSEREILFLNDTVTALSSRGYTLEATDQKTVKEFGLKIWWEKLGREWGNKAKIIRAIQAKTITESSKVAWVGMKIREAAGRGEKKLSFPFSREEERELERIMDGLVGKGYEVSMHWTYGKSSFNISWEESEND